MQHQYDEALRAAAEMHAEEGGALAAPFYRVAISRASSPAMRRLARRGLARALADSGDLPAAETALVEAVADDPDDLMAHEMLALAQMDQDRLADAQASARAGLALGPQDPGLLNIATAIALRGGDLIQARALAEAAVAASPHNPRALSNLGVVLDLLDDPAADVLLDFERLVRVAPIPTPAAFADRAAFDEAVARTLLRLTASSEPRDCGPLVGGLRVQDSFIIHPTVNGAMRKAFTAAVQAYIDAGAAPPGRPTDIALNSWANVMTSGAFEGVHIHEGAWLSGVYYPMVATPDPANPDGGALVLGGHHFGDRLPPPRRLWRFQPKAGDLVLFPSYMNHHTVPFRSPGARISVAFDVLTDD